MKALVVWQTPDFLSSDGIVKISPTPMYLSLGRISPSHDQGQECDNALQYLVGESDLARSANESSCFKGRDKFFQIDC